MNQLQQELAEGYARLDKQKETHQSLREDMKVDNALDMDRLKSIMHLVYDIRDTHGLEQQVAKQEMIMQRLEMEQSQRVH
ncbi:hypothetical protein PR003_g22360, partial [Phytophthora rubi]